MALLNDFQLYLVKQTGKLVNGKMHQFKIKNADPNLVESALINGCSFILSPTKPFHFFGSLSVLKSIHLVLNVKNPIGSRKN